jgi:hypothetical protein
MNAYCNSWVLKKFKKTLFNKHDWFTWTIVVVKFMEISENFDELLETRWMINSPPLCANAHFLAFFIQGVDIMSRLPNVNAYCNSWVL